MGEYVNSKQARFDRSHVSCGVLEMHHLPSGGAPKTLFALATALYHKANPRPAALVIFSDVMNESPASRGQLLADHIKRLDKICGRLMETPTVVNPRTGNSIKLWTLVVDHDAFRKYYQEELANRVEE